MVRIFQIMILTLVFGCAPANDNPNFSLEVVEVFQDTCTDNAAHRDAKCRVELSNGIRLNLNAPIMVGDRLVARLNTNSSRVNIWRAEEAPKTLGRTIGGYAP